MMCIHLENDIIKSANSAKLIKNNYDYIYYNCNKYINTHNYFITFYSKYKYIYIYIQILLTMYYIE